MDGLDITNPSIIGFWQILWQILPTIIASLLVVIGFLIRRSLNNVDESLKAMDEDLEKVKERIRLVEVNTVSRAELNGKLVKLDDKVDRLRETVENGFDKMRDYFVRNGK